MSKKYSGVSPVRERLVLLSQCKEERQKLCQELCKHLELGYSIECFTEVPRKSLQTLLEDYKDDFSWEDIDVALTKGQLSWEAIGKRQAEGACIGNSRSWILNMINRYRWTERVDVSMEHKGAVQVQVVNYAPPSQVPVEA